MSSTLEERRRRRATPPVKSFPVVSLKALEDDGEPAGTFEAIVAVFGNVDFGGDRILPGAFEKTLKAPPEGRGFPPIVWSHSWFEPPIGASLEAEEVEADGDSPAGLRIKGQLFVEDNARAREVYAAMKNVGGDGLPPLREFSFAYLVKQATLFDDPDSEEADGAWRELVELEVYEVGPTLVGMNPETELLDVASALEVGGLALERLAAQAGTLAAEVKAGAVLSRANRGRIESAITALGEVLADADKVEDEPDETDENETDDEKSDHRRQANELLAAFPR